VALSPSGLAPTRGMIQRAEATYPEKTATTEASAIRRMSSGAAGGRLIAVGEFGSDAEVELERDEGRAFCFRYNQRTPMKTRAINMNSNSRGRRTARRCLSGLR
jgi:hypothetical protein